MRALIALAVVSALSALHAEAVKDREGAVRAEREKLSKSERWIWEDVDKGFSAAKTSGKPVLVVLRCVPCLACMGLDTGLLMEDAAIKPLLDQFECVRLINTNSLDLARFQFDYDLSFNAIVLHPDGTVLGRYGSWKHQKNSQETALEGFKKALSSALTIHRDFAAMKPLLTSKQPLPLPFAKPIDIPQLHEKYKAGLDWEGKVVGSCVHCHMIGSAMQAWHREQRKPTPERMLFPFPEPETIGLTLASEEVATITEVKPDSIAAKANLRVGDQLRSLAGAPLISIADVSWALHRSDDIAQLAVSYERDGKTENTTLDLSKGWRRKSDVTQRATVWPMRGMVLGGMRLEPHDGPGLGLRVKGVGQYGMHAMAKKRGFKEGDVILAIGEISTPTREPELLGTLMQSHAPGAEVSFKLQRGDQTLELKLPMQ